MTTSWDRKTPEEQEASAQLFDRLSTMDRLDRAMQGGAGPSIIGFAEIYHFATDPQAVMTAEIRSALNGSARLQADLDRLLARTTIYHFPKVAAASSGDVDSREGDGFKLRLKASRSGGAQLYVILELGQYGDQEPQVLVLKDAAGSYLKQPLPVPVNGMIQLVAEADSDLVKALRDIKTELYLQ